MNTASQSITLNLKILCEKITEISLSCGRDPKMIRLIAISKNKPVENILMALKTGQVDFGENYVQEFEKKYLSLEMQAIRWHFIGHLQSNKAKDVIGCVHLLHTLDRMSLAEKIEKFCDKKSFVQKCLVEVKLSGEESKSGCPESELFDFVKKLAAFEHIDILGLMTIGTHTEDKDITRAEFKKLRELRDALNAKKIYRHDLTELSMGMSADFDIAIEEGATLLRIGAEIFGERSS
jgi:pyridoxal phosphate enzyme (YggS family)